MSGVQEKSYYLTVLIDGKPIGLAHSIYGRMKLEQWRGLGGFDTRLATVADKKKFRRDLRKKDRLALEESEKQ